MASKRDSKPGVSGNIDEAVSGERFGSILRAPDVLEGRVARIFIFAGHWTRCSRDVYTVAGLDRATDLDVLGVRFSPPFRRYISIAECKDGDRPGPLDRVFWLSGVRHYISANSASLVRRTTRWNIKDFAKEAGVEILDVERLHELEKSLSIPDGLWPAMSDHRYFSVRMAAWYGILRDADKLTVDLLRYIKQEVRFHQPLPALTYLLFVLRHLTRTEAAGIPTQIELREYAIAEAVSHALMFLMRVAEDTWDLKASDRNGAIRKGLTYGVGDAEFVKRTLANAHRLASEAASTVSGHRVEIDKSFFAFPEPPYVEAVCEIVQSLVDAATTSATMCNHADIRLIDGYLRRRSEAEMQIFLRDETSGERALMGRISRILHGVGVLPAKAFEVLKSPVVEPPAGSVAEPSETGPIQEANKGDADAQSSLFPA